MTGVVSSINTDFHGRPYVTMQGGVNQFMEPQFSFENAKDPAIARLQKGSKVTLACTGNGDIAKTPMSEDCEFVRWSLEDKNPAHAGSPIFRGCELAA